MARHAAKRSLKWFVVVGAVAAAAAVTVLLVVAVPGRTPRSAGRSASSATSTSSSTTTTVATTTTTTLPAGFVPGHVTAVGDSVMIDYQDPLETDIPGIVVQAAVSEQWDAGVTALAQDKAAGNLGAEVIVALGTNGPVTESDFDAMMGVLEGATKVVFVNVHVDRPWQDPNNAILAAGAARYPNVVIADWASLAEQNPAWFGADGTHLAINGPGADALATLGSQTLAGTPAGHN
ncbi:MAG: hypothetical protein ACRDVW_08410 [Acidimicrobiales bacterium]